MTVAKKVNDQIKAILWDNDGVLVDTEHIYFRVTRSVLEEAGVLLDPDAYRRYFLTGSGGAWHFAAQRGYSAEEVEAMRERRNDLYAEALRSADVAIAGRPGGPRNAEILFSDGNRDELTPSSFQHHPRTDGFPAPF